MIRTLIVDDSLLIRKQLRDILTEAGHDVVGEAEDGSSAPELVRSLHPDVVTLDLIMPGRNGLVTLGHLLQLDPSLVVIVCSASLDQPRVIEALRRGAKGFIVKPFDRRTVLDAVRDALGPAGSVAASSQPNMDVDASSSWTHDGSPRDHDLVNPAIGFSAGLTGGAHEILDMAVANRGVTLAQMLGLEHPDPQGSLIERLGHLGEMHRVSRGGFDPLTFQTSYDPAVEWRLMRPMDAMLEAEPWLTLTLPLHPITAPADDSTSSRADPGAPASAEARPFRIDTYPCDTGGVLKTLSVPLFVLGQPWGVVTVGWDPVPR